MVLGFGMGLIFMSTTLAAQNSVALPQMGVATGLVNFTRQLGGAVGVAIAASVMLTSLTDRLTEAFGASAIDTNKVLAPTGQQKIPPGGAATPSPMRSPARCTARSGSRASSRSSGWRARCSCRGARPRSSATRPAARLEVDALSPEGETFEITSSVA